MLVDTTMDEKEKQQRLERVKTLKNEISLVKKDLNKLNRDKENWYKKRTEFAKQITDIIGDIKGSKDERNEFTTKVKGAKEERNKLNDEIAKKVNELKELKAKSDALKSQPAAKRKETPGAIKKKIEQIEYTLETQPMSFDKEQKLNKELKLLKKQYEETKAVSGGWERISELTKDLNKLRKASNKAHREVQELATTSQERHESVLSRSKEIDDLKAKEQEAFDKFKEFKEEFSKKNEELKELMKKIDEEKALLEEQDITFAEDKKKEEQLVIKEKAKEVQEKVKKKQKLSTEDLLVFQKSLGK